MIRFKYKKARQDVGVAAFIASLLFLSMTLCSCFKKPVFIKVDSVKIGTVKDSILEANIDFKVYKEREPSF